MGKLLIYVHVSAMEHASTINHRPTDFFQQVIPILLYKLKREKYLFACLWLHTSQSTPMVMSGRGLHFMLISIQTKVYICMDGLTCLCAPRLWTIWYQSMEQMFWHFLISLTSIDNNSV